MGSDLSDRALDDLDVETGTRPLAPRLPDLSPEQRRQGKHLAAIHRMHLRDVSTIGRVIDAIEAGESAADALRVMLGRVDFAHNMQQFGTLCGRECQVLTFHHDAEEQHMFPALAAVSDDALIAVIERLKHEHLIVHELLMRLTDAADALIAAPNAAGYAVCRDVFRALEKAVLSHFKYEETELEDMLGLHPVL